jgi:sulfite exporter TauE/SafE
MNVIPFAVLGASLLGSGHCLAMCGGLVVTVARDRKAVVRYHLGRLIGYCTLGGVAGFLGEEILQSSSYILIPWLSTLVLTFAFVFLGVRLWMGRSLHLFRLPRGLWQKFSTFGPGTTGLISAFLPCGWLHAFVLGGVATRSPVLGALYLFCFWVGTLPALSFAPLLVGKVFQPMMKRAPRLSAIILIVIGIGSLGLKVMPTDASSGGHCHHVKN